MKSFTEWNAGRFLRAADYSPGESFNVTVTKVTEEEVGRGDDTELALILALAREGNHWGDFVPRVTNRRILARLFGNDPATLVGKAFTLVVVITSFEARNGFQVQPLAQRPAQAAAPPPPPPRPEPPAANTRPRPPKVQRAPKGNAAPPAKGPDPNDEIDDLIKY
jgi:hypothetical protein